MVVKVGLLIVNAPFLNQIESAVKRENQRLPVIPKIKLDYVMTLASTELQYE